MALLGTAVLVAVVVGVLATACRSSPDAPSADAAAQTVASGFGLSTDDRPCLQQAFSDNPDARVAMATGGESTTAQRESLRGVLETCISPTELAAIVARDAAGAIPGADPARQECLRSTVDGFDPDTRAILLVGLVLSGDGAVTQLDVDLSSVTSKLFSACNVQQDSPSPDGGPTPSVDGAGSAVSTP